MTAKEYLSQAKTLNARIVRQMYRRDELYALMTTRTAKLSKVPGGSRNDRSLEDTMAKYVSLEEKIDREIDALVDLKEEIRAVIDQLPDETEKLVLVMHYLENKSYPDIGKELGYPGNSAKRITATAVNKLKVPEKLFPDVP